MTLTSRECYSHRMTHPERGPTVHWCDKHARPGGHTNCLTCACEELSDALSEIDYAIGKPNEMHVSDYDVHADPQTVVERITELTVWTVKAFDFLYDLASRPCTYDECVGDCTTCRAQQLTLDKDSEPSRRSLGSPSVATCDGEARSRSIELPSPPAEARESRGANHTCVNTATTTDGSILPPCPACMLKGER